MKMTNRGSNAVRSRVALRRLARRLRGVGLSAAWLAGVGTAGAVVSMRTAAVGEVAGGGAVAMRFTRP
jgi:hypothetical protein